MMHKYRNVGVFDDSHYSER